MFHRAAFPIGPLLFIIYINDIPERITHSNALMFADDAKLLWRISSFNDRQLLQEDITSIEGWCHQWHLNLNANKWVALEFSFSEHDPVAYSLGSQKISISQCHRDLGILVCSNLSWANHYSKLCSRAYGSLYMIHRNTFSAALSVRKTLYLSLVRCHLSYCSQLWRPCFIKDIELLERVQRRATKFITGNYEVNHKDHLLSLGLLPLCIGLRCWTLFLVHNLKNPPDNFDIYDHITFTNSDERSTRSSAAHHLQIKHCRTSYGRHFYFNRIARLWNAVSPIDLSLSEYTIKCDLMAFFGLTLRKILTLTHPTLFIFYVIPFVTSFTHPQTHLVDVLSVFYLL